MTARVTWFQPQPDAGELPRVIPSPFDPGPPHPLAVRAAEQLKDALRGGDPLPPSAFQGDNRGKMFGVLVVADDEGRVGWLRGYSGMVDGRWDLDGFVGPTFDRAQRDAVWPAGEAELDAFAARLQALISGPEAAVRAALSALDAEHAAAVAALEATHEDRRRDRHQRRAALAPLAEAERAAAMHALAQDSRGDAAELRRLRAAHRAARDPLAAEALALARERAALESTRARRSAELYELLLTGYHLRNARGEARPLRALFAPHTPPGGAGDCAAPKLFAHAQRTGLRPVALAEFWWGTPPVTGGRHDGRFYPACRGKCGPVLGHMLDGLAVADAPAVGAGRIDAAEPRTVFEDRWLLVVEKPAGLLSVPGRGGALRDSVATRLRARYPDATGPLVVHRLDADTSGLLLAAKDSATHAALQRQFVRREVEKRYVAVLQGQPALDEGVVDLPLRGDLEDRPRQIHDPVAGKAAVTEWRVLSRDGARTRVALLPRTGRTHQLRVHAAHPRGLGAPIVGDRLYGWPGERLMLHAEGLAFIHPHTGQRIALDRPAPF